MGVYGHGDGNPPFDENLRPQPIDPYGIAKYACEMDVQIAGEQHGLDWCIIRPHNVYGEKQNIWDKYRNVLGIWMYQIMNNTRPTIFGDGEQKRAFSYIDDSLEPFWNASQNDDCIGEIINLGGIKEYTINQACDILLNISNTNLKPKHYEQRHEVKYAFPTWKKSVDLLGFEHKIDLEEGLTKMWVQHNDGQTVADSFNVGSTTDNGTGDYTHAFSNNMGAANAYTVAGMAQDVNSKNCQLNMMSSNAEYEAASFRYQTGFVANTSGAQTNHDCNGTSVQICGDLA